MITTSVDYRYHKTCDDRNCLNKLPEMTDFFLMNFRDDRMYLPTLTEYKCKFPTLTESFCFVNKEDFADS